MAKTEFKLVRKPKSADIQRRIIRQEVVTGLKPIAKSYQQSFERVVSNWSSGSKPKFKTDIKVTTDKIEILTVVRRGQRLPNSNSTTADLWKWIDQTGTRPHKIKPKKAGGKLRFVWGGKGSYQSKTDANPARYGGSGVVRGGQVVYRKEVEHPGFKPRKFTEAISRDLLPVFRKGIDAAYKRGLRKAKSG